MFRCENIYCQEVTVPGQPVNRIVVERREKTYENNIKKGQKYKLKVSNGHEIVKEIAACPKCYRKLTGKEPRLHQPQTTLIVETKKPRKYPYKHRKKRKNLDKSPRFQEETKKKPEVEVVNPLPILK